MALAWEVIDDEGACRCRVPGGWLVAIWSGPDDQRVPVGLVFLPDPDHEWKP